MEKLLFKDEDAQKTDENQEENEENPENNEKNNQLKANKDDSKKIILLKNEIKHYDKNLQDIEKEIEKKKQEKMTQNYLKIIYY